jgi:predicted phosphohydrolase
MHLLRGMRIRYLSDLHLEFIHPNKLCHILNKIQSLNRITITPSHNTSEVCILAGDIGNPYQPNYDTFMKLISTRFKKTFVIPGNHEYYNETSTIDDTNVFLENYFKQFNNISFLNNTYEHYKNHCFVGTTLWSKITDTKPFHIKLNDMHRIPKFDCDAYNQLNNMCKDFLKCTVKNNKNCIIITHHVPSYSLIDEKYKVPKMLPYNQWFYNDMDEFVNEHKDNIKCWVYGHTHMSSSKIINNIHFLCNPMGYPNESTMHDYNAHIVLP